MDEGYQPLPDILCTFFLQIKIKYKINSFPKRISTQSDKVGTTSRLPAPPQVHNAASHSTPFT